MWQAVLYVGSFVVGIWIGPSAQDLANQERQAYCEARPQECSSSSIHAIPYDAPIMLPIGGY